MFEKLRLLAHILLGLNFILFISKFSKGNKLYKIFTFYLGLIVLIEIIINTIIKFGYENLIFSHLYFTGQFIILSWFYLELLNQSYQKKIVKFNLIAIPLIVVFHLILNPDLVHKFSNLEILLTSITLLIYSTFHFYNMLTTRKYFYYINCGILIYLFGSTISFLPRNLHSIYGESFVNSLHIINICLYNVYLILVLIEWFQLNRKS